MRERENWEEYRR